MISFIKNIIQNKSNNNLKENLEIKMETPLNETKLMRECFNKVFAELKFFKITKKDIIYEMYTHKINLIKDGIPLTKEEKKALNINVRTKITKEYLDLFDLDKINANDVKKKYEYFYYSVYGLFYNEKTLLNAEQLGIKEIIFNSCLGDGCCEWCKSKDNKTFTLDEAKNIIKNSECTFIKNKYGFSFELIINIK